MKTKVLFLIILFIIVVEIIFRLGFSKDLDFVGTPLVYQYDSTVYYVYTPDTSFKRGKKTVYINNQGFVGNDFSVRDTNYYRIVVIGCSSVSGPNHLVEYYSYPPVMEQKFNENGYKVQVLNCGVDGSHRSYQLIKSIYYQILDFKPNLILFENDLPLYTSNIARSAYNGINIVYPYNNPESREDVKKYVDGFAKYRNLIHFLHHSYILRAAMKWYTYKSGCQNFATYYINAYRSNCWHSWGNEQTALTMEESITVIQNLKSDLLQQNISFFLFQYFKDASISDIARTNKLPLITLQTDFTPDDYYYKDGHWNESGCEKIAESFYQLFIKHKLIPEKYHQ